MDGGGYDVVGGLAHVHVVVGVDQPGAPFAAEIFRGPVGNDLVGVGVGGSAGTRLEDVHYELFVEIAVGDFLGGLYDGGARLFVQKFQLHVGLGRGQFYEGQRPDEAPGKAEVGYGEVKLGPAGGRSVICVYGDLHGTHRVPLGPRLLRCHRIAASCSCIAETRLWKVNPASRRALEIVGESQRFANRLAGAWPPTTHVVNLVA